MTNESSETKGNGKDLGKEVLFPNYQTSPIADQISARFKGKGYEIPGMTAYYIPNGGDDYIALSRFLGEMLGSLPFHNEVGSTKLMRPDAAEVVSKIQEVLLGEKKWDDIQEIFRSSKLEVFKNEVYASHGIESAICYNVDLSTVRNFPANNEIKIQRFQITNIDGVMEGFDDGEFEISSKGIAVYSERYRMSHLHTGLPKKP